MRTRYISCGLLLAFTIVIGTNEDSQRGVFAQVTPAAQKFDSHVDAADSSPSTSTATDNPRGITPSGKIDESIGKTSQFTDSHGDNNGQITTESDDTTIATGEQEPDPVGQLVEAITNQVNEALSSAAAGIYNPVQ